MPLLYGYHCFSASQFEMLRCQFFLSDTILTAELCVSANRVSMQYQCITNPDWKVHSAERRPKNDCECLDGKDVFRSSLSWLLCLIT